MSQVQSLSHHDKLSVMSPGALFKRHDGELTQVDILFVEERFVSENLLEIRGDAGAGTWKGGSVLSTSASVSSSLRSCSRGWVNSI